MLDGISATDALIVAGNVAWTNYQFSAPVRIATDSVDKQASLVFRFVDSSNFYWAGLGSYNHKFSICKKVAGTPSEILGVGIDTELVAGQTYLISVKVVGSLIELWVDGALALSVTDASHTAGMIGFGGYNSHVEVDYADVVAICPTGFHWDVTTQACVQDTVITYTLTLVQTAGGTIYSTKTVYNENEAAVITAVAENLRDFDHWLLDNMRPTAPYDTQNPVTIVMNANHSIQAVFTISKPGGGLVGPLGIWTFPVITWVGTVFPTVNVRAQTLLDNLNQRFRR